MQRSLDDMRVQLEALKPTLKRRFQVETIDIFGFYARGEQTDKSDLDILVTYSEMVDLLLIAELRRYLRRKRTPLASLASLLTHFSLLLRF